MRIKSIALLVSAAALLGACAGEKQDANLDDSFVLLERSNDNQKQVALVEGSFADENELKAYYDANQDSLQWQDLDSVAKDGELDFLADQGLQQTRRSNNNRGNNNNRFCRRNCGHQGHNNWRPHRHKWQPKQWTPRRRYYGFNTCGRFRMYWRGRCVVPVSQNFNNYV